MGRVLPQDIKLTFEVPGVKRTAPAGATLAVVRADNDERLENGGLLARSGRAQDGAVGGDLPPAQDAESEVVGDLGEDGLLLLEGDRVVRLEEDVADSVLAELGELTAKVALGLALEEEVGDTCHDARTIAVPTICAGGATVGHRAKQLASIGDNLVAVVALNVADEADTAGILL